MTQSLVVAGKPLAIGDFGGVLTSKQTFVGTARFIAARLNIPLPPKVKGVKDKTTKEVVELAKAAGHTDEAIKALRKEYDAGRSAYYADSAIANGAMAADPTLRKAVKVSRNKAGEVIGATCTYRKEKAVNVSMADRIKQLESQLAAALAKLPAPAQS